MVTSTSTSGGEVINLINSDIDGVILDGSNQRRVRGRGWYGEVSFLFSQRPPKLYSFRQISAHMCMETGEQILPRTTMT